MARFLLAVAMLLANNASTQAVVTLGGVNVTKSNTDSNYVALGENGGNTIMLDPMIASTDTFAFASVTSGRRHFNIRYGIRDAINSMAPGTGIDFDYPDGAPSYPNDQNHDYFVGNTATTRVNSLSFKVKANVNASDAVLRIKNGTTRSDCRSASSCAVLIAHLNVLQAAWVDGQIAAGALQIGEAFYFLAGPNTDTNTVIIGDHRYMQNDTRYYNAALANGLTQQTAIWNGEHAICVATGGVVGTQYTGLGLPSQTEDQLRSRLKQALLDDARISLTDAQAKANIVWTALDRPTIFP